MAGCFDIKQESIGSVTEDGPLFGGFLVGEFAGRNFGVLHFNEILSESREEELEFRHGHRWRKGIAEVVLVGVVFGAFIPAFFTLGDDVVLEGNSVLVRLHDQEFSPAPGEVNADGDLVSPGVDAVDDPVIAEEFNEVVEGGKYGALLEVSVVLVVLLLAFHGVAFGGELFGRNVAEGDSTGQKPFCKCLIHGRKGMVAVLRV